MIFQRASVIAAVFLASFDDLNYGHNVKQINSHSNTKTCAQHLSITKHAE